MIEALNHAPIRAPRLRGPRDFGVGRLTLVHLADVGSFVDTGSLVAEFDLERLDKHIRDVQYQLAGAKANLKKRRAQILFLREAERQERLNARARLEKALLDLRRAEVRSAIEAEILKHVVDERRVANEHLEEERDLKEFARVADLRRFELEIKRGTLHLERHRRDYDNLRVRAPISGMVIRETIFNSNYQFAQVQEGDRILSGTPFMRIVDLSRMTVSATVNQVDVQRIRIGQEATVTLDAYPSSQFRACVIDVGPVASAQGRHLRSSSGRANSYIRHIPVRILIEDKDKRILPGLSASADVEIAVGQRGVLVPEEAVQRR